ncbi:hypothetical protein [Mycobacteroides chelonae]|uniref:hypothetical protein n=1 Tax=Mycobacteroides chelonae TaxID=1774 RepID=UPI00356AC78E
MISISAVAAAEASNATAVTAWIAFGISVATFVWKFVETYIRWPRLGIMLRQKIILLPAPALIPVNTGIGGPPPSAAAPPEPQPSQDWFDIIVVNSGAEATTVSNIGIRSVDRSRVIDVEQERRDRGVVIAGPELPARVEAHGSLTWIIDHTLTSRFPRGTELIGYAHRYRKYHKWPKWRQNTIKIYETPIEYTKN